MEYRIQRLPEFRKLRKSLALFFNIVVLLLLASVSFCAAQSPSIRFVDERGRTLSQVDAVIQDGVTYLPVNALPNLRQQFTPLTKQLTLDFKGERIYLRIGDASVRLESDGRQIPLADPPQLINQKPMLPMAFFTTILPRVYNLDVSYNPALQRVRITERTSFLPQPTPTKGRGKFVLIIDAGHGGTDVGSRGASGILEKDVVLELGKQLKRICQQNQIPVILTRENDTARRSAERVQRANREGGTLFLSLHCNASFSPNTEGIRIYINNPSGLLKSKRNTEPNAGAPKRRLIQPLYQDDFLKGSRQFAFLLQKELERLRNTQIPVTEIPLTTISSVYMPAILLEVGYLTNSFDEARLADADSLALMAAAIVQAIQAYIPVANLAGDGSDDR